MLHVGCTQAMCVALCDGKKSERMGGERAEFEQCTQTILLCPVLVSEIF